MQRTVGQWRGAARESEGENEQMGAWAVARGTAFPDTQRGRVISERTTETMYQTDTRHGGGGG